MTPAQELEYTPINSLSDEEFNGAVGFLGVKPEDPISQSLIDTATEILRQPPQFYAYHNERILLLGCYHND